jgi:hypothetical protein
MIRWAASAVAYGSTAFMLCCAGAQKPADTPPGPELEIVYDDGHPSERPLLPPSPFEWLIKFEPNLPAYKPLRLRLLLAQPGPLRLTLYAADPAGRPGAPLRTIERSFAPELTSAGQDGKWLLEPLADLPIQTGPVFVGISVPTPGNDAARLWSTVPASASPHVFQRDPEQGTAMQSSRLALTPMLHLVLSPAAAPPPSAPNPAPKSTAPAAAAPPPEAAKN